MPGSASEPKKVGVSEAISHIEPGDHVVIAGMAAEPLCLVQELDNQKGRLQGTTLYTSFPIGEPIYGSGESLGYFIIKTFSVGSLSGAIKSGHASYLPCHFSQVGPLFTKGFLPLDAVMVQVTPPDENGYCSFGVSVEHYPSLVEAAPLAIAEYNAKMPRTCGKSLIHESAFDFVVEYDHPLPEYRVPPPGEVEQGIAKYCAQIIPDGAVLQFGPGKIPSAVLMGLSHKKDLGVHSGLINDVVMDLVEAGCLTGNSKTVNPGKIVCTSAIGTQKLYDFIADNPEVEFYPASYTHSIDVLREIRNFYSLNVALQVDLLGQANSETVNGHIMNGVGGMMDFIRGARESEGGKVIFCLPSTTRGGKESRIVRHFPDKAPVTTTRADIDYIVSEFGIAEMTGRTVSERAEAICDIAGPDFREDLSSSVTGF